MAATIKAIAPSTIHQIQSGQVIVDLCSVVKELVENSLDAQATTIEVRFKHHGLESIEIQDNGTGIAEANYESLALKHYTSKLSSYDDLDDLLTFGFRGEALSSLCALSTLSVTTSEAHETPRGKKLAFESSGKLKSTALVAAQKGTIVGVENLFCTLPVRQKELSKNIKREYSKVLKLLQAYACIATKIKFVVKHAPTKGRSAVVFSTNGNTSTRDNIANVFGSKLLPQLIDLKLRLDYDQSSTQRTKNISKSVDIAMLGHISRPVFGDGKQSTDQQMFYVNGRPCNLPQIAKAINETYKSYNVTQSPFVFANLKLDTSSYDVNVSPDKRTILIHDAAALTENLKNELIKLFDKTEQTVPQSQVSGNRLPSFRQLTVSRTNTADANDNGVSDNDTSKIVHNYLEAVSRQRENSDEESEQHTPPNLLRAHLQQHAATREEEPLPKKGSDPEKVRKAREKHAEKMAEKIKQAERQLHHMDDNDDCQEMPDLEAGYDQEDESPVAVHVKDFNARMAEVQQRSEKTNKLVAQTNAEANTEETTIDNENEHGCDTDQGVVREAYDRMRPRRKSPEIATVTIGDRVVTRVLSEEMIHTPTQQKLPQISQFSQRLAKFNMNQSGAGNRDYEDHVDRDHADDEEDEDEQHHSHSDHPTMNHEQEIEPRLEHRAKDHDPVTPFNVGKVSHDLISTQQTNLANTRAEQDEIAARNQEEYRISELIKVAESGAKRSSKEKQQRTNQALKGGSQESTTSLVAVLDTNIDELTEQLRVVNDISRQSEQNSEFRSSTALSKVKDETEKLSLTISKSDFSKMHIAGQFNLGFIIALRHRDSTDVARQRDEVFIIDQHASDEKYNFERLRAETVVGSQRLVHPIKLELTAVEEEIVFDHDEALRQNGFIIETNTTGDISVGERCQLMSLPQSKELTFNTHDLDELIHLLSDIHVSANSQIPRPSKVRKMFAMRACRSSIMIGRTLEKRQMKDILQHMGELDKPWNCPHGRPTMRHLTNLDQLDGQLWTEGDGLISDPDAKADMETPGSDVWYGYMA